MSPRFTTLLDWVEGRLDDAEAREVEAAVGADEQAQETVEWIREFRHVGRTGALQAPPPQVSARLRSTFSRLRQPPADEGSVAFDTRSARLANVRTPAVDTSELDHLVVADGDTRIVLTVLRAASGDVDVQGRVEHSAPEPPVGEVVLVVSGGPMRAARLDADGSFTLDAVSQDVSEIWFLGHDVGFRCPVVLGSAP